MSGAPPQPGPPHQLPPVLFPPTSNPPARSFAPCPICPKLVRTAEAYYGGLTYTLGEVDRTCTCGRTNYLYDIPVIAVDIAIEPNTTSNFGTKSAIGIYFGPGSSHNIAIFISAGHPNDNVHPGITHITEQAELNAGIAGIKAGISAITKGQLQVSKMVIKTHSQLLVKGMTKHWKPEPVEQQELFDIAKKEVTEAVKDHGIEVAFWLVSLEDNSHAVAWARVALEAAESGTLELVDTPLGRLYALQGP